MEIITIKEKIEALNGVFVAGIVSIVFFMVQAIVILTTPWENDGVVLDETVKEIGRMLMKEYILPFEIVSILLLAALIGAATLARKKNA